MRPDYIQLLTTVMAATKPQVKPVHPTLTYGLGGYFFNGTWFGSDEEAATKARDDHYNDSSIHGEDWPMPQEPMTLDADLELLER